MHYQAKIIFFSMLLTRFPLLGPGFWALCWNHNFCCVSTIFDDFDLGLDSSSELETRKCSGSELESRFNSKFLKNFKHKFQYSDEIAALTNLWKEMLNFLIYFHLPRRELTQTSRMKVKCTCHYTILICLKCEGHSLMYSPTTLKLNKGHFIK